MARDTVQVDIVTNTQKSQTSLLKYAAVVAGATIAAKKLFDVGRDLIKTYQVQERAEAKLRNAIRATGREGEISADRIAEFAGELQKVTTFGDEATISAAALLQQFANLSEEGLKQALPQVQNLAAALGMDLEQAAQLVGKSIGSSTNALSRYGIEIDTAASESEKLEQVVGQLNERFGGTAEALASTTGGAFEQYKNAVGDLKEVLGEGFANALAPIARSIADFLTNNMDTIKAVFSNIPELLGIAFETGAAIGRKALSWEGFSQVIIALAEGLAKNIASAWKAAMAIAGALWDGLRGIIGSLGQYTISIFSNAWANVKNFAVDKLAGIFEFFGFEVERSVVPAIGSFGDAWDGAMTSATEGIKGIATAVAEGVGAYAENTAEAARSVRSVFSDELAEANRQITDLIDNSKRAAGAMGDIGGAGGDPGQVAEVTQAFVDRNVAMEEMIAMQAAYSQAVGDSVDKERELIMTQQELAETILGPQVEAFAVLGQSITDASVSWADYAKASILAVADSLSAIARAAFAQAAVLFFTPGSQGMAGGLLAAAVGAQVAAGIVRGLASNVGEGFQFGGDFVVPPGYEGDTYPMRVNSGERVTVTPKSEVAGTFRGGGGGLTISGTINIFGAGGKEAFVRDVYESMQRGQKTGALAGGL